MEGGRVHCIQCISVTIGESLQLATEDAQKPMENAGFE